MTVMVTARGLTVALNGFEAVKHVSMEIHSGEVLGVFGPNGAGKTTLLKALAGMLKPREGVVYLAQHRLDKLTARERARLAAYLPPYIGGEGFRLRVRDIVEMASYPLGSRVDVDTVLRELGIDHLADRSIETLSAGELQLVLIAHAVARKPKVLLVDEPTAFLDLSNRLKVLRVLRRVAGEGAAVVIATHDLLTAYRFIDRALLLRNGKVVAMGARDEVLTPENIEKTYGIRVRVYHVNGETLIAPV